MKRSVEDIRSDFPILSEKVYGKPLIYLDNGATTQKPEKVIRRVEEVYRTANANVHRGVHRLSDLVSEQYEAARDTVRLFINAPKREEIVFTAGTTASTNAVAFSFGERYVGQGDEVLISEMEHHANIVPWQMLCERKKAVLKVIPFNDQGILDLEAYRNLISPRTKIIAVTQASNVLGTINPVREIIAIAHEHDIPVLIDGAQSVQHGIVDVKDLDCDFFVFSGHKIYGPTGIGVLYGKEKWLEAIPPYQGGGDMVDKVTFEKTTYNALPFKFEAGTTNYAGAIGLAAALDYVTELGRSDIEAREKMLLDLATKELLAVPGVKIYGTAPEKVSVLSFLPGDVHQYDAGMILDKMGIAVRTGTHCAQPVMDHYGITGTVRASIAFYNTEDEIRSLAKGLRQVMEMFA